MRKEDLSIAFEMIARPNIGIQECVDRAYANLDWPDEFKRFNQEFWLPVRQRSLLGPPKAYVIYQLAKAVLPLRGDFIELGCYRGGLSFMLGLMMEQFQTHGAEDWGAKSLSTVKRAIDYSSYGGALLLGVRGITIIGHGHSAESAVAWR